VEHVKQANPDIFFTTVAYPIKNTPYFDAVADRVSLDREWGEVTDRDYVITGRRPRSYYKEADRWLRHSVEAHRLADTDPDRAKQEMALANRAKEALLALGRAKQPFEQ
jgi:hypothetical protein